MHIFQIKEVLEGNDPTNLFKSEVQVYVIEADRDKAVKLFCDEWKLTFYGFNGYTFAASDQFNTTRRYTLTVISAVVPCVLD